jgi:hypothetical protein
LGRGPGGVLAPARRIDVSTRTSTQRYAAPTSYQAFVNRSGPAKVCALGADVLRAWYQIQPFTRGELVACQMCRR